MVDFEVVSLGPTDHLVSGDRAPDFTRPLVTADYWEDQSLSTLLEESPAGVVLVFTPMVGSFVAKYVWDELEARDVSDRDERFVGVSASTPYAVSRFLAENEYPFEIAADPANGVAERFGIEHDLDGMTGVSEPRLSIFLVNEERTIEMTWVSTEWPEFPDYDALEMELNRDVG